VGDNAESNKRRHGKNARLPIQPLELHSGTQACALRKIEGDDLVLSDAVEMSDRTKP
jgi:hypothetical protein